VTTRNVNIWGRLDKATILVFLLIVIIGWFNIYAAVFNEEHTKIIDLSQRYGKQFVWILATLVIAVFVVVIDTRFYFFFAYFIYGGLMFLLMMVLIVGKDINGARSWYQIGSLSLQPSEFAKFGTALALAAYLNSRKQDLSKLRVFMISIAIILFPAFLIVLQPDMGSAVVYFALFIVLFREGMSPFIFISGLIMVILFFFTLIFNNIYLTIGIIAAAFILAWFVTRKWKLCLEGLGIFILVYFIIYLFNSLIIKVLNDEHVLFISIILSGTVYAFYFYNKKQFLFL
jgi:rod shape determining protein RodA